MRYAGLLALVVMATSCASESPPTPPPESLCVMAVGSDGEKSVQRTLRSDRFDTTWYVPTAKLVERLGADLRQMKPGGRTLPIDTCDYIPQPKQGAHRVGVAFSWSSPGVPDWGRVPLEEVTRYDVNGVHVESTYWRAELSVACRLPEELAEASQGAVFRSELSNSLNAERPVDAEAKEQQIKLLYVMARRATDALGCEGDPLKGDPVVKPVPSAQSPTPVATSE